MAELIKICPICHKAFTNKRRDRVMPSTCSVSCGLLFARHDRDARNKLVEEAENFKRKPNTDCRCYDPERNRCHGLNALWCVYEECKFYKAMEDYNGHS